MRRPRFADPEAAGGEIPPIGELVLLRFRPQFKQKHGTHPLGAQAVRRDRDSVRRRAPDGSSRQQARAVPLLHAEVKPWGMKMKLEPAMFLVFRIGCLY